MARTFPLQNYAAQALVLGCVLLGLIPLLWFALAHGGFQSLQLDAGIFDVLWFTLKQAFLSTILSVVPDRHLG